MENKGFNDKMDSLAEFAKAMKRLPLSAAAFAIDKLTNEILNLPPGAPHPTDENKGYGVIRRLSGMLVRSVTPTKPYGDNTVRVFMNSMIAPYGQKVDDWARRRYGKGYLELFIAFYKQDIENIMRGEIDLAIKTIKSGNPYKYRNPFPYTTVKTAA